MDNNYTMDELRTTVLGYLDMHVRLEKQENVKSTRLRTIEGFVFVNGAEYTERDRRAIRTYFPRSRQCYLNAWNLYMRNQKRTHWRYCEGTVMAQNFVIPVLHGWILDTDTNKIIDPSIDRDHHVYYYGVRFTREYAALAWQRLRKQKLIGILHNVWQMNDREVAARFVSNIEQPTVKETA